MPVALRRAPAKINLVLRVRGRRADGFHELDTWMLAVDLCDRVAVRAVDRPGVSLALTGLGSQTLPSGPDNLAARAAFGALGLGGVHGPDVPAGLEVTLHKEIPAEAGMGGGSSDAAGTLLAACEALAIDPSRGSLRKVLAGLGSDCAFFLDATTGAARCTGRGEIVEPVAVVPDWWIALVVPAVGASTPRVYAALDAPPFDPGEPADAGPGADDLLAVPASRARGLLVNDLESAALGVEPGLARWRSLLDGCGAEHFRLSGSGGAFFGLFDGREEADAVRARVEGAARAAGESLRASTTVRAAGGGSLPGE